MKTAVMGGYPGYGRRQGFLSGEEGVSEPLLYDINMRKISIQYIRNKEGNEKKRKNQEQKEKEKKKKGKRGKRKKQRKKRRGKRRKKKKKKEKTAVRSAAETISHFFEPLDGL